MQATLTKIYRSDKDKEGKPLVSKKTGKPYTKLAIKTREHGEAWLSSFSSHWNENWQEGDTVEIEVERRGDYLNFNKPDPLKNLEARVLALEEAVYKKELPTVKHDEDWLG